MKFMFSESMRIVIYLESKDIGFWIINTEWILSKNKNLFLVSDNGSQPTSQKFMKTYSGLEIKQIFTSYNNPKGNAY